MHNGIHSMEEIINHIVGVAISNAGWNNCWQKYLIAEELEITVGELEAVCDYIKLDIDFEV